MGIINSFEQKVFLNLSRHLWNFLGVSGFIAFSTGVILFLNSTFIEFPKSKSNYFGEEYINQEMITEINTKLKEYAPLKNINGKLVPLNISEWIESEKKVVPLMTSYEWAEKNSKPYPISKDGKKLINSVSWEEYTKYRKKQFNLYKKLISAKIDDIKDEDLVSMKNLDKNKLIQKKIELISKQNQQDKIYEIYKNEIEDRNEIKYGQRLVSPLVIGYGLAVVASSSLSAALLSIERNTRKKED